MEKKPKMTPKEKQMKVVEELINKMFEIAGHEVTYNDIKDRKDDWYTQWTMTQDQERDWINWGVDHIRKQLKIPLQRAKLEMNMCNANWGLRTVFTDDSSLNEDYIILSGNTINKVSLDKE